jgi:leucyl/phenylalanyl-tRNA--protein transferase
MQQQRRVPVEPPATRWRLPSPAAADRDGIAGIGGDLEPGTLLAAYRRGLFPMPFGRRRLAWFSPDPRAIIPLDGLVVSRSLRRSLRRYEVRQDADFGTVMIGCADPLRPGAWITPPFVRAYVGLHQLGWAHSFECYDDGGILVGGLYGVRIGGFFAGEAMFHRARDASKVALVRLVEWLGETGGRLLDVQWPTPHLMSLGAIAVSRDEYLRRLAEAVDPGSGRCPGEPGSGQRPAIDVEEP